MSDVEWIWLYDVALLVFSLLHVLHVLSCTRLEGCVIYDFTYFDTLFNSYVDVFYIEEKAKWWFDPIIVCGRLVSTLYDHVTLHTPPLFAPRKAASDFS